MLGNKKDSQVEIFMLKRKVFFQLSSKKEKEKQLLVFIPLYSSYLERMTFLDEFLHSVRLRRQSTIEEEKI